MNSDGSLVFLSNFVPGILITKTSEAFRYGPNSFIVKHNQISPSSNLFQELSDAIFLLVIGDNKKKCNSFQTCNNN